MNRRDGALGGLGGAGPERRAIGQTERRVLHGETVPTGEKVLSIFEEHTDIIKKGQREPTFGHKVFLSAALPDPGLLREAGQPGRRDPVPAHAGEH